MERLEINREQMRFEKQVAHILHNAPLTNCTWKKKEKILFLQRRGTVITP